MRISRPAPVRPLVLYKRSMSPRVVHTASDINSEFQECCESLENITTLPLSVGRLVTLPAEKLNERGSMLKAAHLIPFGNWKR